MPALFSAALSNLKYDVAQTERVASEVIELSARYNFAQWLPSGNTLAVGRSASGEASDGISWIEDGIRNHRATGGGAGHAFYLALKAEAFY